MTFCTLTLCRVRS